MKERKKETDWAKLPNQRRRQSSGRASGEKLGEWGEEREETDQPEMRKRGTERGENTGERPGSPATRGTHDFFDGFPSNSRRISSSHYLEKRFRPPFSKFYQKPELFWHRIRENAPVGVRGG